MKVSVDLELDLLYRLCVVRDHLHTNSEVSFLPVPPMDEFILYLVEAAVRRYEEENGVEVCL